MFSVAKTPFDELNQYPVPVLATTFATLAAFTLIRLACQHGDAKPAGGRSGHRQALRGGYRQYRPILGFPALDACATLVGAQAAAPVALNLLFRLHPCSCSIVPPADRGIAGGRQ
jgi:hypothetical protein